MQPQKKKKKKKTERRRCFVLFRIKYVFVFLFQSLLISATFPALGWWRTLCCKFFKLHIFLMPEHPDELTVEHLGQVTICTSVIRLVPATNSPSCHHLTVTQWHSSATIKCSHAFCLCTLTPIKALGHRSLPSPPAWLSCSLGHAASVSTTYDIINPLLWFTSPRIISTTGHVGVILETPQSQFSPPFRTQYPYVKLLQYFPVIYGFTLYSIT